MLRVGLTGGIGSGKSAVAARLSDRGAFVIDADLLAREVVARGSEGLTEVIREFGPSLLTSDSELDRAGLAQIVFEDPSARRRLEEIVHPRVRARAAELEAEAAARGDVDVVVHDIPLLVETGQAGSFDLVVVVDADDDVRVARLVARGLPEAEARARIGAQARRQDRLDAADVVVDNSGTWPELDDEVERLWGRLQRTANAQGAREG
ncbi:MAG: dephospho-CoA kinase [Actinomycetales bacterium]